MLTDDENEVCAKKKHAENNAVEPVPVWSLSFNEGGKVKYTHLRRQKFEIRFTKQ